MKRLEINLNKEEEEIIAEAIAKVIDSIHKREENPLKFRILTNSIGTYARYRTSMARLYLQTEDLVEKTTMESLYKDMDYSNKTMIGTISTCQ